MASYHFTVKSKTKGYATQHYAYISRLMQYANVRQKSAEVLELVVAGRCMPSWVKDPLEFWRSADIYERDNAKVYMEYEFALPNEFTAEQRKTLVETFLDQHVAKHHYPHSYAIHSVKSRLSSEEQPHCHMMFSLKADDGLDRTAEQYFKRYNAKEPAKGGVKKIQLQEGHANYSEFLLFIRQAWANHLNEHLSRICPTISYQVDGQSITIKNQVSAASYDKYNQQHGTLYLPEPKLGAGKQNETAEYLHKIHEIRLHNERERLLEQTQTTLDQQHDPFYSYMSDPYSSLEILYYLNYIANKAKDLKAVKPTLDEILIQQKPILVAEQSNLNDVYYELNYSAETNTADTDFNISLPKPISEVSSSNEVKKEVPLEQVLKQDQAEQVSQLEKQPSRNNDFDYDGPK